MSMRSFELIIDNYRPVSSFTFISKISKKGRYCDNHELIPDYQSAYRKFYSRETALLKVVNELFMAVKSQNVTALVAIDLSAAACDTGQGIIWRAGTSPYIPSLH